MGSLLIAEARCGELALVNRRTQAARAAAPAMLRWSKKKKNWHARGSLKIMFTDGL